MPVVSNERARLMDSISGCTDNSGLSVLFVYVL